MPEYFVDYVQGLGCRTTVGRGLHLRLLGMQPADVVCTCHASQIMGPRVLPALLLRGHFSPDISVSLVILG